MSGVRVVGIGGKGGGGQGYLFVLVTSLARDAVFLISADLQTGAPQFREDARGKHVFSNEDQAFAFLSSMGAPSEVATGVALLGWIHGPGFASVLLATRVSTTAELPGGHQVLTVAESQWVTLLAGGPGAVTGPPADQVDPRRVQLLQEFPVQGGHYYCLTADLTRGLPGSLLDSKPSPEFWWNAYLTAPLHRVGVRDRACPVLIQGLASQQDLLDAGGRAFSLVLLSRRSQWNAGTRYNARGLDQRGQPGNEVECELVLATKGSPCKWSSWLWRRGTVPIHWSTEIKNKVGEAEIVISTRPYDRSLEYLERISANTLTGAAATSARGAASPSPAASVEGPRPATATNPPRSPLATVSGPHSQPVMGDLLGLDDDGGGGGAEADRGGRGSAPASALEAPAPDSGLLGLADLAAAVPSAPGSQSSAGGVAGNGAQAGGARGAVWGLDVPQDGSDGGVSSVGLPPAALGRRPVTCVNLLRSAPGKSELVLTEHFQTAVSMARAHGVPVRLADFDWHGAVRAIGEEPAVEAFWHLVQPTLQGGGFCCGVVHGSAVSLSRAQAELVRFNCADSLDRTNVASYFCSVMVLQWMAGALGLEVKAPEQGRGFMHKSVSSPAVGQGPGADGAPMSVNARLRGVFGSVLGAAGGAQVTPAQAQGRNGSPARATPGALPEGWEARVDPATGRTFYIDHNTRTTSWLPPVAASADEGPGPEEPPDAMSVAGVRRLVRQDILAALAELFLVNGDLQAMFYTGSRAMHSGILGLLAGTKPQGKVTASLGNMALSVQRRFQNVVQDSGRQLQYDLFLGKAALSRGAA